MIVIGYQGIGKSTVTKQLDNCIDLESSMMKINGHRDENWFIPYGQIALDLSRQGNIVFTASHRIFREWLEVHRKDTADKILCIVPALELKDLWLEKLQKRWEQTNLLKDRLALLNAEDCFIENITEMYDFKNCFEFYEIQEMNYDLKKFFENLENVPEEDLEKLTGIKRLY